MGELGEGVDGGLFDDLAYREGAFWGGGLGLVLGPGWFAGWDFGEDGLDGRVREVHRNLS